MASKSERKTVADFPELVAQWHPTRNGEVTPVQVTAGNNKKKLWWTCPKGPDHQWQTSAGSRVRSGSGCPFCAGQRATSLNNLARMEPDLAQDWHPTLNGALTPSDVTPGSSKKVWWVCTNGPDHQWEAAPKSRSRSGQGCPFCAGRRASVTNSLAALHPELASAWHPSKNEGLRRRPWAVRLAVWRSLCELRTWLPYVASRCGSG